MEEPVNLLEQIINKSTNVKVETFDEFIKNFTRDSLTDKKITTLIKSEYKRGIIVGEKSGFGVVKKVTNTSIIFNQGDTSIKNNQSIDIIIKKMNLCPDNIADSSSLKQELCEAAQEGDFIFHIPDSVDNKTILLAPNTLTELIISKILGQGDIQKYCPNFTKIYDVEYDRHTNDQGELKPSAYVVMESLEPLTNYINNKNDAYWMVWSIAWGLSRAQELHRYVHFDLHYGNIMARKRDQNIMTIYELDNGEFLHSRQAFDPIIIDYGMNRLETEENIVIPRILFRPNTKSRTPDWLDYYAFNPFIDMFTAIYSGLYLQGEYLLKKNKIKKSKADMCYIIPAERLMAMMFNSELDETTLFDWIKDNILLNNWRPKPEMLSTIDEDDEHEPILPTGPQEMVEEMAELFRKEQRPKLDINDLRSVAKYMKNSQVIHRKKLVKLVGVDGITSFVFYPQIPKKDKMDTMYPPVNTISLNRLKTREIKIHEKYLRIEYIPSTKSIVGYIAEVNQKYLLTEGYKWEFDCCRTIIQDVLRRSSVIGGISINASFFKIGDDFEPIGIYKTPSTVINNNGQDQKYYSLVGILPSGLLDIVPFSLENVAKFTQVLSTLN
jgi:hypothetical protein